MAAPENNKNELLLLHAFSRTFRKKSGGTGVRHKALYIKIHPFMKGPNKTKKNVENFSEDFVELLQDNDGLFLQVDMPVSISM